MAHAYAHAYAFVGAYYFTVSTYNFVSLFVSTGISYDTIFSILRPN